jgi:hypothetical protein
VFFPVFRIFRGYNPPIFPILAFSLQFFPQFLFDNSSPDAMLTVAARPFLARALMAYALSRIHAIETQGVAPWIFAQGEECGA